MNATQLLTGPLAQSIGWALLHLLWQATIVAGILAAVLALLPRRNASARYIASCAALATVFALFVVTAVRAYDPAAASITAPSPTNGEAMTVSLARVPMLIAETAAATWRERTLDAVATARQSLPSIVAIWLMGVVVLSARLLVSWMRARGLATRRARPAGAHWQEVAARLSEVLGLRRAVRLLESAAVDVPSVVGSLRPVILLPASTLTGMTPEQIEMVLAHELAHIRRHDFLVNLLQAFIETLMFYHPAVWWMSRRVRIEREHCCDDLAVAVCGNPLQYARALTRLEELRAAALPVVVAANGGSLLDRIRRIATGRSEATGMSSRLTAALVMLTVLGVALALPSLPALAQREEPKTKEESKPASAQIEVVEATPAAEEESIDHDLDVEVELPEPHTDIEIPEIEIDVPPIPASTPMPPVPMVAVAPALAPVAWPLPTPHPSPALAPHPPMAMVASAIRDDEDAEDPKDTQTEFGVSGKLTVDELIQLRSVGVTADYVKAMRATLPAVTLREIRDLRAAGVSPEYVREIREAGLDVKGVRELQRLRTAGVTAEYVRSMRAAGVSVTSSRDATSLRSMNVTPQFVKQLADAGYATLSVRELTHLAAIGVDGDFIREMEKCRDKR